MTYNSELFNIMTDRCPYNDITGEEPTLSDCSKCEIEFILPYRFCCLKRCGKETFCNGCSRNINKI